MIHIQDLEDFGNDWETFQEFLRENGNPEYRFEGNLNLRGANVTNLGNLKIVGVIWIWKTRQ